MLRIKKLAVCFVCVFIFSSCRAPFQNGFLSEKETNDFYFLFKRSGVSKTALKRLYKKYQSIHSSLGNKNYVGVIDYTKHSSKKRFFVLDIQKKRVYVFKVTHGRKSDTNDDGYANSFGNKMGCYQSSLGFYQTDETYYGRRGYSMRIKGLSPSNSLALKRGVVIHASKYVQENCLAQAGRSLGCPAVDKKVLSELIKNLKGGSLIYAYGRQSSRCDYY